MDLLIYLIAAAVIGWVATTYVMHDNSNLLINIVVAVVGAYLAGIFLTPMLGVGSINSAVTIPTMLVTLLGSVILLFLVRLIRRGR